MKGRNEARRRNPGDSGADSSGVLSITAAHASVLLVLRGAITSYPARYVTFSRSSPQVLFNELRKRTVPSSRGNSAFSCYSYRSTDATGPRNLRPAGLTACCEFARSGRFLRTVRKRLLLETFRAPGELDVLIPSQE